VVAGVSEGKQGQSMCFVLVNLPAWFLFERTEPRGRLVFVAVGTIQLNQANPAALTCNLVLVAILVQISLASFFACICNQRRKRLVLRLLHIELPHRTVDGRCIFARVA